MLQSDWLAYTGTITGIIGAITGIAGSIMGYIGYRRSEKLKALDLRLELRKADTLARSTVDDLPSLLERAKASRNAVSAATGMLGSGNLKGWLSEWETDFRTVKSLQAELPSTNVEYTQLDSLGLEAKLVAIHALHLRANQILEKYNASLAADDIEREHLRADVREITQSKLGKNSPQNN